MNSTSIFHLIMIVVAGVIVADLVAHVSGTTTLFKGIGTLFTIGTQPTNTSAIKRTTVTNTSTGTVKA